MMIIENNCAGECKQQQMTELYYRIGIELTMVVEERPVDNDCCC